MKLLLMIIISGICISCNQADNKTLILDKINNLEVAIENKNAKGVRDLLSGDFVFAKSNNNNNINLLMNYYFNNPASIVIYRQDTGLSINNNVADYSAELQLAYSHPAFAGRGKSIQLKLRWIKENGNWKLLKAGWVQN